MNQEIIPEGSLDALAIEANELHKKVGEAAENVVLSAWDCGARLNAAKEKVPHGEWAAWVETNFSGSIRTARIYMGLNSNRQRAAVLEDGSIRSALRLFGSEKDVVQFSGEYEWYTPEEFMAPVHEVLGRIDLDPASCSQANVYVKSGAFYTKEENGLDENNEWWGKVFLNPPYCQPQIADFVDRLLAEHHEHETVTEAILLTNNSSDAAWFQEAALGARAVCFTRGRISFINGGDSSAPLRGQAFFYFGPNIERFVSVFSAVGVSMVTIDAA